MNFEGFVDGSDQFWVAFTEGDDVRIPHPDSDCLTSVVPDLMEFDESLVHGCTSGSLHGRMKAFL